MGVAASEAMATDAWSQLHGSSRTTMPRNTLWLVVFSVEIYHWLNAGIEDLHVQVGVFDPH